MAKKLRRKALAEKLGVSVDTIDKWRKDGFLPAASVLVGTPVWDEEEIEAWVRSRKEKPE